MEKPQVTVDWKLFQMMPYIIILKVRKFHQLTANRFSTARQKPQAWIGLINFSTTLPNLKLLWHPFYVFVSNFWHISMSQEPLQFDYLIRSFQRRHVWYFCAEMCYILQWAILDIFRRIRRIRTLFRFLLTKLGYFWEHYLEKFSSRFGFYFSKILLQLLKHLQKPAWKIGKYLILKCFFPIFS